MTKPPFTLEELEREIAAGFVKHTKHPWADLHILNYTAAAQYHAHWNEVTNHCRGLIIDGDFNIVARPFPKFHNYSEHEREGTVLPAGRVEVTEKMDGSLGILYWIGDQPCIATRGSFTSDQAFKANQIFREWMDTHPHASFNRDWTYLFEIVYAANRIVVNYGDEEKLVLLAVIDNETGLDLPLLPEWYTHLVKRHPYRTLSEVLTAPQETNREGFVVRFLETGLRLKVKFDEYVALHRILTQTSSVDVWEWMTVKHFSSRLTSMKPSLWASWFEIDPARALELLALEDDWLEGVPDEFHSWVEKIHDQVWAEQHILENAVLDAWTRRPNTADRKELARYAQSTPYEHFLYKLIDNESEKLEIMLWKAVQPERSVPFQTEGEVS